MHKRTNSLLIVTILVISISSMFALLSYLTPLQQSTYAASPNTSDLKNEVKQNLNQDNLCHRSDGCNQANEGQQLTGKDNAASGFNDQSTTNTSSPSSTPSGPSLGTSGPQGAIGPKGEIGPAGPDKTLQVIQRNASKEISVTTLATSSVVVDCNPGETVTGGGFLLNNALPDHTFSTNFTVLASFKYGNGWIVEVLDSETREHTFEWTAFVQCASLVP